MSNNNLRVVGRNDSRRPLNVIQAAASGDRLALLMALRDRVAETVHIGCAPRELAALSLRLADLAREIEAIQQAAELDAAAEAARITDEAFDYRTV